MLTLSIAVVGTLLQVSGKLGVFRKTIPQFIVRDPVLKIPVSTLVMRNFIRMTSYNPVSNESQKLFHKFVAIPLRLCRI